MCSSDPALRLAWDLEPALALARGVATALAAELGERRLAYEDGKPRALEEHA